MKKIYLTLLVCLLVTGVSCEVSAQSKKLKLIFIRHGEKPDDGDNLTCQGLNRSMLLPTVLFKKFGRASHIYVPAINQGKETKRVRMLQTILPYAVKYNVPVNTVYNEENDKDVASALFNETGTIIIVWEHSTILPILADLGVKSSELQTWPNNDFDSIYIITFSKGAVVVTRDKENLSPPLGCPF